MRPTRLVLAVLICSLVASALIGISIILVGDFDDAEIRVLATAGTLAGFSILSLPSFFHLERARYKYLTRIGLPACLLFFGMVLFMIWGGNIPDVNAFWKTMGTAGIVAFSTNHALLMLIATPAKRFILGCQIATVLIIVSVAVLILIPIWTEEMPDVLMRPLGTLGILNVLGTISVPLLVRVSRSR